LPVDEQTTAERKKAYAGLIDLLEKFARDTDGTLAIKDGIDKCELENCATPFTDKLKLFGTGAPENDAEVISQFKRIYRNILVNWPYGKFSVQLRARFVRNSDDEFTIPTVPDSISLLAEINTKNGLFMSMSRVKVGSQLHLGPIDEIAEKLVQPILKPMMFFVPKIIPGFLETMSKDGYYCPFGKPSLDEDLVVRSSNVAFGNAFARNEAIQNLLLNNKTITAINVGGMDLSLARNARCVVTSVNFPCKESDLKSSLDLVFATLDLIESYV